MHPFLVPQFPSQYIQSVTCSPFLFPKTVILIPANHNRRYLAVTTEAELNRRVRTLLQGQRRKDRLWTAPCGRKFSCYEYPQKDAISLSTIFNNDGLPWIKWTFMSDELESILPRFMEYLSTVPQSGNYSFSAAAAKSCGRPSEASYICLD